MTTSELGVLTAKLQQVLYACVKRGGHWKLDLLCFVWGLYTFKIKYAMPSTSRTASAAFALSSALSRSQFFRSTAFDRAEFVIESQLASRSQFSPFHSECVPISHALHCTAHARECVTLSPTLTRATPHHQSRNLHLPHSVLSGRFEPAGRHAVNSSSLRMVIIVRYSV